MTENQLDKSLEQLDLFGVFMLQGLLVNRGLKLLQEKHDTKAWEESMKASKLPVSKLIL